MRYLLTILFLCGTGLANAQALQKTVGIGDTDVRVRIKFLNADGTAATGLGNTEIALYYQREGAVVSSEFSSGDKSALNDAHSDGAIGELGTSGVYEIDVPDAAFADSATSVYIWGASSGDECVGATVQVTQALTVNSSGHITPADGSISEAKFADVSEPTPVPPTSSINPLEMIKYMYFYGAGINKTNSDLTSGEGEMQYYDSGGTKRFERDVTKSGTVTTKDEVRAND